MYAAWSVGDWLRDGRWRDIADHTTEQEPRASAAGRVQGRILSVPGRSGREPGPEQRDNLARGGPHHGHAGTVRAVL
ncbi:hypothetical protein O3G_MSEX014419 [Manduca sexta]|uniref:Uncharacterized protein n=1 Tax=Manduca sexta TaxID=7130 RepID=A0A922CZL6_MANSE|nr:hypothetical protein O3G_MSEX014419 [Manduca sexta]